MRDCPPAWGTSTGNARSGVADEGDRRHAVSRQRPHPRTPPIVVVDDLIGRVEIRPDPQKPTVRLLDVAGHAYGAINLEDPTRLELDYLARLKAVLDVLLPAGPAHIMHLGGGAFALPRALAFQRPELMQVVVERSRHIIQLAQRELGLRAEPALTVVHEDARAALDARADASVDAVVGDAFVGRETPRHLATVEFVAEVARVLRTRGVYVLNLIDAPPWSALSAHAATVGTALPHMLTVAAPEVARLRDSGNMLLVASRHPLHRETIERRLAGSSRPVALVAGGRLAALARRSRPRHDADG